MEKGREEKMGREATARVIYVKGGDKKFKRMCDTKKLLTFKTAERAAKLVRKSRKHAGL
jgi:hypothetical protein